MTAGEKNVLGLDVAMDDVMGVGMAQGVSDFQGDLDRIVDRELALAFQPVPERFALDEGHDIEEESIHRPRVEEPEDVWVLQLGGQLDLALESLTADGGGQVGIEDLDRHFAVVPDVAGQVDRGHPPLPKLSLEEVAVSQFRLQPILYFGHAPGGSEGSAVAGSNQEEYVLRHSLPANG